jgi:hypothetical protein
VKEGHAPTKAFICDTIPEDVREKIETGLGELKVGDVIEVKGVFASHQDCLSPIEHEPTSISDGVQSDTQIASLLEGIKLGVEALHIA